ncbi:baseplate wedge protein, partial [archaeon]|nr:baseplate wedge protein [archaeon]
VESVNAYGGDELDPPEYGKVFISIKPRNGTFLSEVTKQTILSTIRKYSIAGIRPQIIDLSYLYIELESAVYYNANQTSNPEVVRTKVIDTLTEYSNSKDVNSFGGRFKYSKAVGLIDDCNKSITSNITKVKMRRDLNPELNTFATYELCFGNRIHVNDSGYSVKSTGFLVEGVADVLYMTDKPSSTNGSVGTIIFFKLENNGDIRLDVVNITSSVLNNGFIEVQAIPESNDIIGLQDLYLQLDVQNSVVNTVEDVVSSGENSSATQYVTTSSYLNGKYTR